MFINRGEQENNAAHTAYRARETRQTLGQCFHQNLTVTNARDYSTRQLAGNVDERWLPQEERARMDGRKLTRRGFSVVYLLSSERRSAMHGDLTLTFTDMTWTQQEMEATRTGQATRTISMRSCRGRMQLRRYNNQHPSPSPLEHPWPPTRRAAVHSSPPPPALHQFKAVVVDNRLARRLGHGWCLLLHCIVVILVHLVSRALRLLCVLRKQFIFGMHVCLHATARAWAASANLLWGSDCWLADNQQHRPRH